MRAPIPHATIKTGVSKATPVVQKIRALAPMPTTTPLALMSIRRRRGYMVQRYVRSLPVPKVTRLVDTIWVAVRQISHN